ncbi:MAG: DUF1735 domain-containing protein [Prevotella sp.]|nr:DUF1735 domain-containing protein [Prevotella sp.]
MKRNIIKFICGIGLVLGFWSCENSDISFPDYEGGTTVYFPYQYPVRTIVLGDDEYDTTLDQAHQCKIMATFGGSYNGSNGTVQVAVDESLVNNLTFENGEPVKAMPSNYYSLSTTNLAFNGTMNGATVVQLTDAFFNDPDAVKNTYVIPLVMTGQSGFGKILTGQLMEGFSGSRCDESVWDILPKDYVLYCVKFQNKYSGWWLTNGNTSTDNIEKASTVQIKTKSMTSCIYTVSYLLDFAVRTTDKDGNEQKEVQQRIFTADLLLSFDGSNNCTISSLTDGVKASGSGSWGDNSEKKAWGNKDRDGMELNYTIDFGQTDDYGNAMKAATHEKMVYQRSGVKSETFTPIYTK